jgi:hypothetical protein
MATYKIWFSNQFSFKITLIKNNETHSPVAIALHF